MKKLLLTTLGATLFAINMMAQDDENAMLNYGINFLDVPYVAHTLEVNDNEELVINCDEVDCTTFVEYVLAMALSPTEDGQIAEGDFAENLTKIRYRDGKIDGYPSRLHYIADWVNNGVRNGFLEDITAIKSPDTQKVELSYTTLQTIGKLTCQRGAYEGNREKPERQHFPLPAQRKAYQRRTSLDKER